jgi:hypothetical protein
LSRSRLARAFRAGNRHRKAAQRRKFAKFVDIMAGPALPVWAMTQQLHGASRIAAPAPELRAELSALLVVLVGLLPLISVGCGPPS